MAKKGVFGPKKSDQKDQDRFSPKLKHKKKRKKKKIWPK